MSENGSRCAKYSVFFSVQGRLSCLSRPYVWANLHDILPVNCDYLLDADENFPKSFHSVPCQLLVLQRLSSVNLHLGKEDGEE